MAEFPLLSQTPLLLSHQAAGGYSASVTDRLLPAVLPLRPRHAPQISAQYQLGTYFSYLTHM